MRQFVGFAVATTEQVSGLWRWLPLACYLLICIASIACSVAVGTVTARLQGQCPLFARLAVTEFDGVNITLNELSSSEDRTHWGELEVCYTTQFLPIFGVLFSVAWFFFFCMCGKGGRGSAEGFGMDSPWRIVCPGLFFNFGMMLGYLVSSIWISRGVAVFCHSLKASHFKISCQELDSYRFTGYPRLTHLGVWFTLAETCSWLAFSGLLVVTLLLCARCMVRPDLTPLYEPVQPLDADTTTATTSADPENVQKHRTSSGDTYATADTSPVHGPEGDVIVHASD